jgi:hypothetical protein
MSVILYHAGGAGDFEINAEGSFSQLKTNVQDLLRVRGKNRALELLARFPFDLCDASNHFNDDFSILHAAVPLQLYEEARKFAGSAYDQSALRDIAETTTEIGPYIRFIAVSLDTNRAPSPDPTALTAKEINTIVYKYIGVNGGYLGDFSYRTHREFYSELELKINPDNYPGTTRQRFTQILSEADPKIQASILTGILEKYPGGSAPIRTEAIRSQIAGWIRRLSTGAGVAPPTITITSAVVERALADAEKLIGTNGATSGVDRTHTALHGYLIQTCTDAGIAFGPEPTLAQLLKLLRGRHPAFADLGPRADDISRMLNSMATIMDALNPIRNKASVAHPNANLLPDAEAMLVINSVRTLIHYLDAKLYPNGNTANRG